MMVKVFLCFFIGIYPSTLIRADDWVDKDNRLKGKTQQSRPVNPQEYFANKRIKV
jgi:hypothetical protein